MKSPIGYLAAGELALAILGLVWANLRSLTIPYRIDAHALAEAILTALVFAIVNLSLYRLGRRFGRPAAVYAFLENEVFPLFRRLDARDLLVLVLLVGLGEEVFFRGVLQQEVGLVGASLVFGFLHGPSRTLWPLALWATGMGLTLGVVYQMSGNLFVPALAHALYDGVAIAYARRLDASRWRPTTSKEADGAEKDPASR